jgi:hypothetical protein
MTEENGSVQFCVFTHQFHEPFESRKDTIL